MKIDHSWFSWQDATNIKVGERDEHVKHLVFRLKGKPVGTRDYTITGNMLLLAVVLNNEQVEVWDCDIRRHTWGA